MTSAISTHCDCLYSKVEAIVCTLLCTRFSILIEETEDLTIPNLDEHHDEHIDLDAVSFGEDEEHVETPFYGEDDTPGDGTDDEELSTYEVIKSYNSPHVADREEQVLERKSI